MFETALEISAGAVIFKKHAEAQKVIVYSRRNASQWCLPKGKIEKDETKEQAAIREVKEETGLEGLIIDYLDEVRYSYVDKTRELRLEKTVYYFLMKFQSGEISTDDPGVETVVWADIDDAIDRVSFSNEKRILEKAKSMLRDKRI